MKNIIILIATLTVFQSCKEDKKYAFGELNPNKIEKQIFRLKNGVDTTLTTKSGVIIHICSNTFVNTENKDFDFIVQEALSKGDILKSGLPTMDKNGQLLESGGMVYINTKPRLPINSNCPITVNIPTKGINSNMKQFTVDIENGEILWTYQSSLSNEKKLEQLKIGEQLFIQHCTNCHHKDLDSKLTGPPLGCIEVGQYSKNREWLIKFTRNSQKMIAQNDSLAMCSWLMYRPVIMTNFEHLTDVQINQIYDYINNESQRRDLCSKKRINEKKDSINCYPSNYRISFISSVDTTPYYTLQVKNYIWINCDYFISCKDEVEPFKIKVKEDVEMYMIFKNFNTVCPFVQNGDKYIMLYSDDKEKLNLPLNEPITILAFTKEKNGKRSFVEYDTTIKDKNSFSMTLSSISEKDFQQIMFRHR